MGDMFGGDADSIAACFPSLDRDIVRDVIRNLRTRERVLEALFELTDCADQAKQCRATPSGVPAPAHRMGDGAGGARGDCRAQGYRDSDGAAPAAGPAPPSSRSTVSAEGVCNQKSGGSRPAPSPDGVAEERRAGRGDVEGKAGPAASEERQKAEHNHAPAGSKSYFYKTRLCKAFETGECKDGEGCKYAHGTDDIRRHARWKMELCPAFTKKGKCKWGEKCSYAHGKEDLRQSDSKSTASKSPGKVHLQREDRAEEAARTKEKEHRGPAYKKLLCRYFAQGFCQHGEDCSFAHGDDDVRDRKGAQREAETAHITVKGIDPRWKTRMCRAWETGTCKNGNTCKFAHGKDELRSPPRADPRCGSRTDQQWLAKVKGRPAQDVRLLFRDAAGALAEAELGMRRGMAGAGKAQALAKAEAELEPLFVATAAVAHSRPELTGFLPSALGKKLRALWAEGTAQKDSEERRCRVEQLACIDGSRTTAVRALLDEVKLLVRVQHPNLERVVCFAAGEHGLYYEKEVAGQRLQQWCRGDPPAAQCRRVVRDYLEALAHLESHEVTHGRVRPCVLRVRAVDGAPKGVLCDLRLAQGCRTNAKGDGEGGWEEGLPDSGADVHHLGRGLLVALSGLRNRAATNWCRELLSSMMSASAALEAKGWLNTRCEGCDEPGPGVECSNGHLHCGDCFEEMLRSYPVCSDRRRDGKLLCTHAPDCDAEPFKADASLLAVISEPVWELYQSNIREVLEDRARKQGEIDAQRMLEQRELQKARQDVEEALNLRCPNPSCGLVFTDWTYCIALNCVQCSRGFCGFCMQDCGEDAHRHVVQCPLNTSRDVYPVRSDVERAHRQLRQQRLDALVKKLRPAIVPQLGKLTAAALSGHGVQLRAVS